MEVQTPHFAAENNFVLAGTMQDIPKPAMATMLSFYNKLEMSCKAVWMSQHTKASCILCEPLQGLTWNAIEQMCYIHITDSSTSWLYSP